MQTVDPQTVLPTIIEQVTINGYSQPGASENTLPVGNNAVLLIELNGSNASFSGGLTLSPDAGKTIVEGLVINRFDVHGISVISANECIIRGNFIGTNAGTTALNTAASACSWRTPQATFRKNIVGGASPG